MYRILIIVVCTGLSLLCTGYAVSFGLTLNLIEKTEDVQILSATRAFSLDFLNAGDCNGDGIDDVIVRGRSGTVVSVIFGQKTLPKIIQLSEDKPPDLVISNVPLTSSVLPQVSVADLNGDQIGDLLVTVEDGLYVFWGRKKWPKHLDMRTHNPDLRIIAKGKRIPSGGAAVLATTGDINHDGMTDLLFAHAYSPALSGEYLPTKEEWKVRSGEAAWIFWGRKTWPGVINLSRQESDVVIMADEANPFSHRIRPFRIADLDGDGFGDIIAGAWGDLRGMLNPPIGAPWARGWIIRGRSSLPRKLQLEPLHGTSVLRESRQEKQEPLLVIDAWPHGQFIGGAILVGDLTGDGIEDLVVTVLKKGTNDFDLTKQLCLLTGNLDFFSLGSSDILARCTMIVGGASFQVAGPIFSPRPLLGDFNGDGRKDLFVLLEKPDFAWAGLLGRGAFPSTVNFNAEAETTIHIPPPWGTIKRPGYNHSSAMGDINGDGKADLLIGDALGGVGPIEQGGPGAVHIVLGRDLGPLR